MSKGNQMEQNKSNGWDVYQKLVLTQLADLKEANEKLASKIEGFQLEVTKEISALKVKSGVWGFIGGMMVIIPPIILFLLGYLR